MNSRIRTVLQRLGGFVLLFSMVGAVAQQSAGSMLEGTWTSGSAAFYDLQIEIAGSSVTLGRCHAVPYTVIRDRAGHGPGPDIWKQRPSTWREIAIELKPETPQQGRCLDVLVLDFSIPSDMLTHADVAFFGSRSKFETQPDYFSGWGVWGKEHRHSRVSG